MLGLAEMGPLLGVSLPGGSLLGDASSGALLLDG